MLPQTRADFRKLWAGQTISEVGSRITREGLPLTGLLVLHASVTQMGYLAAVGSTAVLVFSLGAGIIVDRFRKRPLMIATDVGRAVLLALIPAAAFTRRLSFPMLLTLAAVTGILTVLFDVAYQSYLPALVDRDDLHESNRRLAFSAATAEMLGPALTGILIQAITAPIAILLDAISFLASAVAVGFIRKAEAAPVPRAPEPILQEALQGMRFIWAHAGLRALLLRSVISYLSMGIVFPLYLLSAIRIVHLSTSELGLAIALGGAGSLLGSVLAGRISRRFPLGPSFLISSVLVGLAYCFVPLAAEFPRWGLLFLCIQQFFSDSTATVYMVNEATVRQALAPPDVIGRVNGAMQLAGRGMLPFGALAGGYLGDHWGVANALWLGVLGVLASSLALWPLRRSSRGEFEVIT